MKNKNSRLRFFSMLGNLEGMRENKSVTQKRFPLFSPLTAHSWRAFDATDLKFWRSRQANSKQLTGWTMKLQDRARVREASLE